MHDSVDQLTNSLGNLGKRLPGFLVLMAVLILLRGPKGTLNALVLQVTTLLSSFLGTGDGLGAVVVHTLPLAGAAAIATLLIARKVLTFESFGSFVALASIIAGGAVVGGFLSELLPHARHETATVDSEIESNSRELEFSPHSETTAMKLAGYKLGEGNTATLPWLETEGNLSLAPTIAETQPSAWQQLTKVRWLAEPKLAKVPQGKVDRLRLLPETGSVIGLVSWAINQLLGYLVAYQPRLFLAAVIAGGWMGWSMHHHLGKSS